MNREGLMCKCPQCGRVLPKTREYFARYDKKTVGYWGFHELCRECEAENLINDNWKDGKLKCFSCGQWLDPEMFDKHSQYKYRGHKDKRCKKCKRKQNKQARKEYSDEKRLLKVLQFRWLGAKERAERNNLPFDISKEYVFDLWKKQKGLCAISDIPMTYTLDKRRVYSNVSIDQINHKMGYTKDNVQLVCSAVNQLKSDWNMETVLYICRQIVKQNRNHSK